jgi:hypothetical protein
MSRLRVRIRLALTSCLIYTKYDEYLGVPNLIMRWKWVQLVHYISYSTYFMLCEVSKDLLQFFLLQLVSLVYFRAWRTRLEALVYYPTLLSGEDDVRQNGYQCKLLHFPISQ